MPEAFDGGGAYLVDSNTVRIQVNHETLTAKISEVDLNKNNVKTAIQNMISFGNTNGVSFVNNARLAYTSTILQRGTSRVFCRFCSSQSYGPNSFGPNRGFVDQLYITGEECSRGRLVVLDSATHVLYQLSGLTGHAPDGGNSGMPFDSWENAALIDTGETEHVALLLSPDGGSQQMKLYIGKKGKDQNGNSSNTFLARNGLAYGSWYYLHGTLPDNVGHTIHGAFGASAIGALEAVKLEDVDTSPSDPTRVVLGVQISGVFTFRFHLDFGNGFDAASSSFTLRKIAASVSSNVNSPDNVDWTHPTTLGTKQYAEGLIFINEDNESGEIWSMRPDGTEKVRIGSTRNGQEATGLFDFSEFVDYAPGSIIVTSNQGFPSSMTLLINPDATPLSGGGSTPSGAIPSSSTTFHAVDTQIWQVSPSTNYVGTSLITVDQNDRGGVAQALIQFPGLGIPAGTRLVSASLAMHCSNNSPGTVSAYRMFQSWSAADVTWNTFGSNGVANDGAEAASTASFTFVEPPGSGLVTADVTADVTAWLSGSPNYGWVLINDSNDGWDFDTAETKQGPTLTVFYAPTNATPLSGGGSTPSGAIPSSSTTFHAVDTQIWQVSPSTNYVGTSLITVDQNDRGGVTQALIQFPGLGIPAGTRLVSASLAMHCSNNSPGTVSAYRMFQSWSAADVTWNTFGSNGVANDGAEAASTASFTFVEPPGSGLVAADVTADVTAWLSGSPNYGWVLINDSNDGWDFDTAETKQGPTLTVFYEPTTTTTTSRWVVIDETEGFEESYGIWNKGGPDALRVHSTFSPSGWYSIRIRDDTTDQASMTTRSLDVNCCTEIKVTFDFFAWSMEAGEDFFLESSTNGGISWETRAQFISGLGLGNAETNFYFQDHHQGSGRVTFGISSDATKILLRFRCDASQNNDRIYIDNVKIEGKLKP
ncbi:hypothetical protein ACA910_021512 [Epithemia clementina (nom. ined.)]